MNVVVARLFEADGTEAPLSLGAASAVQWLDELAGEGSFSFTIPVEAAPTIAVGQIVKFALGPSSADYVWAGVIESIRVEQSGAATEGVARTYAVNGRGVRALLEDAVVYNDGASATRSYTNQTAGDIFLDLFNEAQARGALSALTVDFDAVEDSDGNPFTETLTIDISVGTPLLAVVAQHQELAVDAWVGPDLVVHYVNERGTDLTSLASPVVLRVGQNVGELAEEQAGPVRNTVLVASGTDGTTFTTEEDSGSQTTYGRRETYLSLTNTTDAGLVSLAASHVLANSAAPADGVTVQLHPTGPLPYLDFNVGDTLYLAKADGTRTSYRVRSITVSIGEDGSVSFIPELGTAKPDLTKRLANALARIERNDAGSELTSATFGGGLGGGGAELVNGEVMTYNSTTESGTVDIDGTTYNFTNATGFGLDVGDIVVTTDVSGITDKVAVGIFDRVGSYTPIVINNPQAVSGFPFDGDQLPNQFNYPFNASASGVVPSAYTAAPGAWYGSAVLGYSGRVLVFLSRTGTTAQVPIIIYDVETGSSTAINRTPGVGATNRSHSVGVVGTRMFITYDGTTGNCVESWNSSTGTWTAHDIQRAVYLGVSDGRAWWVGLVSGATNPTRWRVISIDGSGTLSHIENPAAVTAGTQIFGRAKNGKLYFRINTSGALLYVADANVAASSLTFTSTTAPATLPYSNTAAAGTVALRDANRAYACSDIDDDGYLYFFVRTGTPTTAGFAKVNSTTLAVTTYTQLTSSTGNASDGEIVLNSGLCLAGSQVVLFGAVIESIVAGGSRADSAVPAYWRTDGVTTNRTDDTEYVGAVGPSSGATQGAARTSVIHRDDVSNTFYFHTNLSDLSFVPPSGASAAGDAKTAGPAYGEAFTV